MPTSSPSKGVRCTCPSGLGVTYSIVQKATNAENEWRYYQGPQVQDGNPEDEEYLLYLDTDAFSISPDW